MTEQKLISLIIDDEKKLKISVRPISCRYYYERF